MSEQPEHPYDNLTPDTILGALESLGLHPDGGMLALNSYENRVYQIGIDDDAPLVAKFYRPERWSDECIHEEHRFSLALAEEEIPVIAPLVINDETLHEYEGFRFSLYPRRGGRWPELDEPDNLEWIGRLMSRIHQLGASQLFQHRPDIDIASLGSEPVEFLLNNKLIPIEQDRSYREVTGVLLEKIGESFDKAQHRRIRLHGDCHPGNILWTDDGSHFVDMDDCRNGPAIQDLWMLLSGEPREMALQLSFVREGYETFRELDTREVQLIEPLRTLRMIHYAAWLARRWDDPAFPKAFPWFNTTQYWQEHIATLQLQIEALDRPPLPLY
ncbi:serine/threonine protein kinase [Solemya velesiana gill symbiont]|uniref:Stress response kinase A n=1 Tax=Solemya velesiana gill symbiont TaxID=1918948 RepID=A0A1T2KW04_9GAMM|nr:serine/threonine protein kinase [Solemya velesiana gill symbiont]OOZ37039.1 stress response serine/threonine protein kinase YihE [Solemya velesiana gill symbiont]